MLIRRITGTVAIAASAAMLALPAGAFTVVGPLAVDVVAASGDTVATVSFDAGTPFGASSATFASGAGTYGFAMALPAGSVFSGASASFRLPEVTVSGAAGWVLSDLHAWLGPLMFSETGNGTTSARLSGALQRVGEPPTLHAARLTKTVTSSIPQVSSEGYFSTDLALPGPFTSIRFSGGQLTLTATPGSAFALSAAQPSELRFSFTAVAVPEPGTWAMLAAGLLWVMWAARRRQPAR